MRLASQCALLFKLYQNTPRAKLMKMPEAKKLGSKRYKYSKAQLIIAMNGGNPALVPKKRRKPRKKKASKK